MAGLASNADMLDVRWRLKSATASSHKALEASVPLMRTDLDQNDYLLWIMLLYGFYAPAEKMLSEYMPSLFNDWQERIKLPWLVQDLLALGLTDEEINKLPHCYSMPETQSKAHALGFSYVLEGATLGGQVINRRLRSHLDIDNDNGGRFYYGYGDQTGKKWKSFETVLRTHSDTERVTHQIVQTANSVFKSFRSWIG